MEAGDISWDRHARCRSFDDNGLLALFRQHPGEELARDAAANHQVLKVLDGHDDAPALDWPHRLRSATMTSGYAGPALAFGRRVLPFAFLKRESPTGNFELC